MGAPGLAAAPRDSHEVIVVGGGMAGLAAAWFLEDRDVLVLESGAAAGGRVVAGTWRGWTYARGAEYIGPPEGALGRLIADTGLTPVEIPAPMDARIHRRRLVHGSAGLIRILVDGGGLNAWNRFLAAVKGLGAAWAPPPDHDPDGPLAWLDGLTAADWFARLDLPPIYTDVWNVFARGVFGAALTELSALCLVPELYYEVADADRLDRRLDLAADPDEPSGAYSFAGGLAALTNALAAGLGTRLETGARVTGVTGDDASGYRVAWVGADGVARQTTARAVVLATPAPVTAAIAGAVLGAETRALVAELAFAPYATIAMMSEAPIFDDAFDLALPDGLLLTDLYDSTWIQRRLGTPGDGHIVSGYAAPTLARDPMLREIDDRTLAAAAVATVDSLLPGAAARVIATRVQRFRHGFPVMAPGTFGRLAALHRRQDRGGPVLAGDWTAYPTLEAAARSGALAAGRIRARLG